MDQNTSSSSSINAAIDSFPLLTLENFVNSMNEQNGFGRTFNNSTSDNHRSHSTISTTIPEPSSISPPLHCTLPSNFNASVSVSGTSNSGNRDISNSSDIPSSNIPTSAVISSTDSINNNGTKPHECFGKKNLTASEYSKNCEVHHVNRKSGGFASTWRLRCMECTKEQIILDLLVEYIFCFLTTIDGAHCFMIKLYSSPHELFLIPASVFKTLCPINYVVFYKSIDSYNSLLSDLMATIEEQKSIVEKCFDCEILQPYKTGIFIDTSKLPNSLDSQNAVTEIRRLFFLELELEMGEYMRKNINMCSEMVKFVMNFYENRDRAFSIISVEDVKKTYISLYNDLVQQS